MANTLAIVSKKVFETTCKDASVGDIIPFRDYRSKSKALDSLSAGDSLFLVTVRPPDEQLWLVAELTGLRKTKEGWSAETNTRPIRNISQLVGRLKFASGKGITAAKGRLGMSLQSPRALSGEDVALLRDHATPEERDHAAPEELAHAAPEERAEPADAASKPSQPSVAKPPTPPANRPAAPARPANPAVPTERFEEMLAGRMEAVIPFLRDLTRSADASVIDAMLEVGWIDIAKWRSTEATAFWVNSYFLLMCLASERHLAAIEAIPEHPNYSVAHQQVVEGRKLVATVLRQRGQMTHRGPSPTKMPKTRGKMPEYLSQRLGDPSWDPTDELIAFVKKPRFKLESFEGLAVFAALLVNGDAGKLGTLKPLAKTDPLIARLLVSRGIPLDSDELAAELLAAIYAEPDNLELRAVFADRLMEHGDPRGELIRAQLAAEEPELAVKDALSWSGSIAPRIKWRPPYAAFRRAFEPRYRHGFLSGCQVEDLDGELSEAPEWSTIEVLDCRGSVDRVDDYHLPRVFAIGLLDPEQLSRVAASDLAAQLVVVGFEGPGSPAVWDVLGSLPNLRGLVLGHADAFQNSLAEHPLLSRLEVLVVPSGENVESLTGKKLQTLRAGYGRNEGGCLPFYDRLIALAKR